jgi:hypothetical protein
MSTTEKRVAFAWQEKTVLRLIRESCPNYASALGVYSALTIVASDKQSDQFTTTHDWLGQLSGFKRRTVLDRLKELQRLGIVAITTPKMKAPSTYMLLRPALNAQRYAINAQGCARDGGRPLHTSEQSKEESCVIDAQRKEGERELPSAGGGKPGRGLLTSMFEANLAKEAANE